MWDLCWTKWHWDSFFSPSTSGFPCQLHYTDAPLLGKTEKKRTIFITGLHNKPQGCGASVASAAGTFITKKEHRLILTAIASKFYKPPFPPSGLYSIQISSLNPDLRSI
jgi:hypothetical protein